MNPFHVRSLLFSWCLVGIMPLDPAQAEKNVWLSELDLSKMTQGWGRPQVDRSVQGNPLAIGGVTFARGVGTHATSVLYIDLQGGSRRFAARVGVDDEVRSLPNQHATLRFRVYGDGRTLWKSGTLRLGDAAQPVDLDVSGVRMLVLAVEAAEDGIDFDHADWAEARFEVTGAVPAACERPRESAVILTPKAPAAPRINGPGVFGVRPGSPVLYTIPATGARPLEFSADGVPPGLMLDKATGRISGTLRERGEHVLLLGARNAHGTAERKFRIVAGDTIALTPPLGWSTWYMAYTDISDAMIRAQADAMVSSGLVNHGYCYVNIDDGWNVKPDADDPDLGGPARDAENRLKGNRRFPDMAALCKYVHERGLRIGIYISPGPTTCAGYAGSLGHEEQDACTFAEWGFDFLKYDWCSYDGTAKDRSIAELKKPYLLMYNELRKLNRDFVYNLCQYGMGDVWEWGRDVGGNYWRTTGDLGNAQDLWSSMSQIGFSQAGKEQWAGPGGWNDPDNILIGHILWGGKLVPTPLTPNEQYTYVSLWCLLASPLILGGDLTKLDEFTLGLLTNDEVLAVNQDVLGRQARRAVQDEEVEIWCKDLADGSKAVGLFNRGEVDSTVRVTWNAVAVAGRQTVRDLWRQADLGVFADMFESTVPRHGVELLRLLPENPGPATPATGGWWVPTDDSFVRVTAQRRPVLNYRAENTPFKPYVKELFTPGGTQVLLDSPPDHVHHRGLMFAVAVDGVNFWEESERAGKEVYRGLIASGRAPAAAGLDQRLEWLAPDGRLLAQERRSVQAHGGKDVADAGLTLLTWTTRLAPPAGVPEITLTGNHYYGLGMRFLRSMDKEGRFLNAADSPGVVFRGEERLVPARWCAYAAAANGKPVTVAMFDDPANPRSPATWFTMKEPFAYLSATMKLHEEPLVVKAGETLALRYGVALWDGYVDVPQIEKAYQLWLKLCGDDAGGK